jgi:hypothetical protein
MTQTTFHPEDIQFYSDFQAHLADGNRLADGSNTPIYLLGQAFDIQQLWFARYFSQHCPLPTLQREVRVIPKSQLRLKFSTLSGSDLTPSLQAELETYLLEQLNVARPDEVKFEHLDEAPHCCHSPCFGCMSFNVEQALERQGPQPFLLAMQQAAKQQDAQQQDATPCN